ncbi:MAG TPA: beta-1,6-N-acetylglucosaminyltransferase [Aequorivita sp.]|nr:beta-1,6-N-acetylglucosaminyltransferase [Aequorivita sp.]
MVAYLILAHTDPTQLYRLVTSLGENCLIFIHLDSKTPLSKFTAYDYKRNVHFIENRVAVSWAGFNMVVATLNLIQAALQKSREYSHLVLLSGLDYPIKPVCRIQDHLKAHPEKEFIKFINVNDSPENYLKIFRRLSFKNPFLPQTKNNVLEQGLCYFDKGIRRILGYLLMFYRKKPMPGITPCFGSQWWAITPACAQYILDFVGSRPDFVSYFKTTFGPDEYFFHTIIGNSPFLKNADGFQVYEGRGTYKMANLHIIHPSLAKTYTLTDFKEIQASTKFFVRKVSTNESSELIDKINKELLT